MERIDYKISTRIAKIFPMDYRFYRTLRYIFFDMNGLGMFLHLYKTRLEPLFGGYVDENENDNLLPYRSPISYHSAFFVLQHITARTLRYRKPFEFIRYRDMTNGLLGICIPPIYYKPTIIKQTLNYLTGTDILIKLSLPWNEAKTAMYGLNLPHVLADLASLWGSALFEEKLHRRSTNYETWQSEQSEIFHLLVKLGKLKHQSSEQTGWKNAIYTRFLKEGSSADRERETEERQELLEKMLEELTQQSMGQPKWERSSFSPFLENNFSTAREGEPKALQELIEKQHSVMLEVEPLYSYLRGHAWKPIKNIDSLCVALEKIADAPDEYRMGIFDMEPMHE